MKCAAQNPYAAYEFSLMREGKESTRFLENITGYLQADAFVGYDQVFSQGQIIEVARMAHCRRYWREALWSGTLGSDTGPLVR